MSLQYGPDTAPAAARCLYFAADCRRGYGLEGVDFLGAAVTVLLQMGSYGVQQALKSYSVTGTNAEDTRKSLHDFKMQEEPHFVALFV